MRTETKKQILLCVTGLTPQIVTETLYALTQERGERIDEIRVITTIGGRDKLKQLLLDPQHGRFFAFCRDYGIDPGGIAFDETTIELLQTPNGQLLADIRTLQENEYAGDQICDIVRELTKDANTRIHASAAGGRKTMSIYLTAAMQLFGRAEDTLTHVLVNEDFETHPDFYYIPRVPRPLKMRDGREVSTSMAAIYLANIPFIRLQGIMSDRLRGGDRTYNTVVRQTQADLDLLQSAHDLMINLSKRRIEVASCKVRLTEREFFVYSLFAHLRRQDRGFVSFDQITVNDLDAVFRRITRARGMERPIKDYELAAGFDFLDNLRGQIADDDRANPESLSETFRQTIARIKRKFDAAGRLDRYLIINRGGHGTSAYGLDVAPEHIVFT